MTRRKKRRERRNCFTPDFPPVSGKALVTLAAFTLVVLIFGGILQRLFG